MISFDKDLRPEDDPVSLLVVTLDGRLCGNTEGPRDLRVLRSGESCLDPAAEGILLNGGVQGAGRWKREHAARLHLGTGNRSGEFLLLLLRLDLGLGRRAGKIDRLVFAERCAAPAVDGSTDLAAKEDKGSDGFASV